MGRPKKNKGLGDIVEDITKATGIKAVVAKVSEVTGVDCGCDKRKDWLNNLSKLYRNSRCMTDSEISDWGSFKSIDKKVVSVSEVKYITELYASLFNTTVYKPCSSCSPKPLIAMIDKIDKIYENR